MGLFAPWFLAGIAAVAVPFYVHLLRRHTTTPHPFSSLMFFERRTQSSIKHRRLRYLLLLSLRTLLLLLLALAFANPFINRTAANMSSEKLVLLVIDNSFSMRAGTRLADARREALSVLSSRRPSDRAQVMALGSQIQVLTQPSQDSGALRAAIESLQPGDSHGNFGELARSLRSLAESVATPIELHLFSDMQKSALPASFNELALPANVSLILHPVVILMAALHFAKEMPRLTVWKAERHWERYCGHQLAGSKMTIIGLGKVGSRVAQLSSALGVEVVGHRRTTGGPVPVGVSRVVDAAGLDVELPDTDLLAIAAPDTPETRNLVDRRRLELLPPRAVLVNVGRGSLIDEPALIEMLAKGRLRGAALDVFAEEPLPTDSPLWGMPNVIISPHSASTVTQENDRLVDLFIENLNRYLAGVPLVNRFDHSRRY